MRKLARVLFCLFGLWSGVASVGAAATAAKCVTAFAADAPSIVRVAPYCPQIIAGLRPHPRQPITLLCGLDQRFPNGVSLGSKVTLILLLGQHENLLETLVQRLIATHNKLFWETRIVVVVEQNPESVSRVLWRHNLQRSTIAVLERNKVHFFRAYSETGGVCEGMTPPQLTKVAECSGEGELRVLDAGKLEVSPMLDLKGCVVDVATIHFPPSVILFSETDPSPNASIAASIGVVEPLGGIEVALVRSVGAAMNFLPRFYVSADNQGWGAGHENGTFSGMLGELTVGRAEIAMGCLMPLPVRFRFLDMAVSHGHRSLAWAVPPPRPQPRWAVLVEAFTPDTWAAVAAVLVLAFLVLSAISHDLIPDGALLFVWATTLGVSVARLPRASWTRTLLLGWLLAFLVLSAAYQGALFSFLAATRYEKALDSFKDIVLRGLPLVAHPNFEELLDAGDATISQRARELYEPSVDGVLRQLDVMAKGGRQVACMVNKEMLVWYNYQQRHSGHVRTCQFSCLEDFGWKLHVS
ncbi:Hypothetical predicted protein [Cloeon dipterum]|uniref:Ionotropic glutamate receptor L-glutamate and glycine-binding domain-containing protein n=2 Tax=Cloeon dipterum TaxID=197152 RepID=A0A8S1DU46_9INSE|nr:Hypothetical predicted protein [Cloeon dipterum]